MNVRWQRGPLWSSGSASTPSPLVLKIGGSLLSRPHWPRLVEALVADVGDRMMTIVVGGGAIVDGLREIDDAAPQSPQVMHDIAIDALHLTAQLVARVTGLPISATPAPDAGACVLDVPVWLLEDGRSADLPASWNVTSDSIAARVAAAYGAELMLAKSLPPPSAWCGTSLDGLAKSGWVDGHFPTAAAGVTRIGWTAPA